VALCATSPRLAQARTVRKLDWATLPVVSENSIALGLGRLNNHLRVEIWTFGAGRTQMAIREIEWEFDRV